MGSKLINKDMPVYDGRWIIYKFNADTNNYIFKNIFNNTEVEVSITATRSIRNGKNTISNIINKRLLKNTKKKYINGRMKYFNYGN